MEIKYYKHSHYGQPRMYVLDAELGKAIALLTGTKTITKEHVDGLVRLGFSFTEVLNPNL